jgi:ring-1,2-phenylacetyl-CoA epoxidase subunit PaaC
MNNKQLNNAIKEYAIRLGDDSLILGHRISEWSSNGPYLEEDIALSNTALDYIGRARLYYSYAATLSQEKMSEDDFAYTRDARQFSNLLINELPRGDFAFTMVRQLLIDAYNLAFLPQLICSKDPTLAAIAGKAIKETQYHFRRSRDWVLRLGDGTQESHTRTQAALNDLWGYTHELFESDALEQSLIEQGIAVDNSCLKEDWKKTIDSCITQATLTLPEDGWAVKGGRKGYHTENLGHLLTELQFVHRSYPGLQW